MRPVPNGVQRASSGCHEQILAARRPEVIAPVGEVPVGQFRERHVLSFPEAGSAGELEHVRRGKETEEGRSRCRGHLSPPSGVRGGLPRRGDRAATGTSWPASSPGRTRRSRCNVAAFASFVRYMLTPVEATTAGLPASKPAAPTSSHHEVASKSTGTSRSHAGTPKPSSIRRRRFQACGPGRSTSKTCRREAISGRRWANVSSPAPRSTYWSTPRTASAVTRSSMNRARATMDARNPRVKTGSMSGRSRHPSSGATNCNPTSSSSTWGDASTRTCRARHKAVRTAVLSGPGSGSGSMSTSVTSAPRAHVGEEPVHPPIARQLGVKARSEDVPLTHQRR